MIQGRGSTNRTTLKLFKKEKQHALRAMLLPTKPLEDEHITFRRRNAPSPLANYHQEEMILSHHIPPVKASLIVYRSGYSRIALHTVLVNT